MKASFSTLLCPGCQRTEKVLIDEPVISGCQQCFSLYTVDSNGRLNSKQPALPRQISLVDPKWMMPGAQIRYYENEVFTLHSVMLFFTQWTEYDSEDGWQSGSCENPEYYFVSESGKELCITEDDGKLFVRTPVTVQKSDYAIAAENPETTNVVEYGDFSLMGFIGQDDEPLDRDVWQYKVVSKTGDIEYEWKKGKIEETLQCYSYHSIAKLDLERMLIRDKGSMYSAQTKAKELAFYRDVFGYSALLLLCLLIYSLGHMASLCNETWNFSIPTNQQMMAPDSVLNKERIQRSMGVFSMEKGHAYSFNLECSFANENADAEFNIQIVRQSDGQPVNDFQATFYSETGRDDDGAWSESTLSDKFQFQAEESGTYEIFALVKPDDTAQTRSGRLTATVYPVVLTRFFLTLFIISTLIWLIFQWKWEYEAIAGGNTKIAAWLRRATGR